MKIDIKYQTGFWNHFSTEALPGALPLGQNSPQKVAYGLYAEQLSGSPFTAPRLENLRSWLYRIRPSVLHSPFKRADQGTLRSAPFDDEAVTPTQLRWDPLPVPKEPTDFLEGLVTVAGNGAPGGPRGSAVHLFLANRSMEKRYFYNADGELLIVPQLGELLFRTEMGELEVHCGEIVVIPRGVKFCVELLTPEARGYVCENYGAPFRLPYLGTIGANGCANSRDFFSPVAKYEDLSGPFELVAKFHGKLWRAEIPASPLDVVAWHGNYTPYKYDLANYNAMGTVTFDHPDPSIWTVLTSPSEVPGTANVDFVIFPPRWGVAEHTFRPPYFHRNLMSEYMGLVRGVYDAKAKGFLPGGGSLHNCMSAHGPDNATFETASNVELKPHYYKDMLAFMFESSLVYCPTSLALQSEALQKDYLGCWRDLKSHFTPTKKF